MLENDAQMILTYLESNGGFMTLNDKSSPDDIMGYFWPLKGWAKLKALGGLMKAENARPVWYRINLVEAYGFILGPWQNEILCNSPKAILWFLLLEKSAFPKTYGWFLIRWVDFLEEHASLS